VTPEEVARKVVAEGKLVTIPEAKGKVEYKIEKSETAYYLPSGESRVVLIKLPTYSTPYTLKFRSNAKGGNFFAPTIYFLDSEFKKTNEILDGTFLVEGPSVKMDVQIDEQRKGDVFLLVFTEGEKLGQVSHYYKMNDTNYAGPVVITRQISNPVLKNDTGLVSVEIAPPKKK
jgi:hypothetical protein